jgi:hypothetical protein
MILAIISYLKDARCKGCANLQFRCLLDITEAMSHPCRNKYGLVSPHYGGLFSHPNFRCALNYFKYFFNSVDVCWCAEARITVLIKDA